MYGGEELFVCWVVVISQGTIIHTKSLLPQLQHYVNLKQVTQNVTQSFGTILGGTECLMLVMN